jgi:hypothetical protein
VELGRLGDEVRGHHRLDHQLADRFFDLLVGDLLAADLLGVLARHHDRLDADRHVVDVADRHLGLAVGAEEVDALGLLLADLREPVRQLVRDRDRQRHQLLGLVARVAEHQALIAGALLGDVAAIDALGDVGRLLLEADHDAAGVGVEAHVGVGVTDLLHGLADDRGDVDVGRRRDLATDQHEAGLGEGLARHARAGVVGEDGVEDPVRDGVAQFVGMTFGDGLGGEQVACHGVAGVISLGSRVSTLTLM